MRFVFLWWHLPSYPLSTLSKLICGKLSFDANKLKTLISYDISELEEIEGTYNLDEADEIIRTCKDAGIKDSEIAKRFIIDSKIKLPGYELSKKLEAITKLSMEKFEEIKKTKEYSTALINYIKEYIKEIKETNK